MRKTMLLLVLWSALPAPATMYKWVDEKGVTQYTDTMPPQHINRGMTEMNKTGVVVKKVEPALTAEQLKTREDESARQKELGKQAEERRRRTLALLGTYTSEQEIDLARDRNTQQIDVAIRSAKERLTGGQARVKELTQQVTAYQDKDRSAKIRIPPAEVTQELTQARIDEAALQTAVIELLQHKLQVVARFNEDKLRFREITQNGVTGEPDRGPAVKAQGAPKPANGPSNPDSAR